MSASSKKKLRNEQAAEKLTERQLAEKKEAKKLKIYTAVFSVVVIAMLIFAITFGGYNAITNSGILERSTVAATVNGHDLSNTELNYYYIDYVNNFCNQYSSYISYILDTTMPLDQQSYSDTQTWADYFLDEAMYSAASTYALADAAKAAGYTLTDADKASIESSLSTASYYAMYYYGYTDLGSYLKGMYGNGANEKTYRAYLETSTLASSYYNAYTSALTYTDEEIRAVDAENPQVYNSYSYNYYYIPVSDFLTGGTTDAEGKVTYSDEENEATRAAAEEAAKTLAGSAATTVEQFDLDVALVKTDDTSMACDNYLYASLLTVAQEWIADSSRQAGDKNYFAYSTHTHAEGETHSDDEDSAAFDVVKGYYVVMFRSVSDNATELVNVRHCLIAPTSATGASTFTEEEWAVAEEKANALLEQWKSGDATEDSFATMANANSTDTGSNTNGGLYENVYPGQMVSEFNDWCFDAARVTGDTAVVKTSYGFHIMYFVGNTGTSYRDFMINEELTNADITEWYSALTADLATELKNTKYIATDLVLGG